MPEKIPLIVEETVKQMSQGRDTAEELHILNIGFVSSLTVNFGTIRILS